jgi:hypothetical protein
MPNWRGDLEMYELIRCKSRANLRESIFQRDRNGFPELGRLAELDEQTV